jgi:hypothetical protein
LGIAISHRFGCGSVALNVARIAFYGDDRYHHTGVISTTLIWQAASYSNLQLVDSLIPVFHENISLS